ncbi:aspartyl protease family protein [Streptomyces hokutonensis]|uniref:aspartyl protease family protein n=1 Tax=Streptomyces hokutonensis TaxID=1306990 RepID=UPI003829588E
MLSTEHRAFEYMALIDSGADINVFDIEIAIALGLDLRSGEASTIVGVTGLTETVYFHPITLTVGGVQIETRAAFMERSADYGIVGQKGFFDHFIVSFNRQSERIDLKQVR